MGQGKLKRALRKQRETASRPIAKARFDLLAIGSRMSPTRIYSHEQDYWSDFEERVLGLVFRDRIDNDYGWILLARDKIGRFRCVDLAHSLKSADYATSGLRDRIAIAVEHGDFSALGDQEDETNYPTDLLTVPLGTDPQRLHRNFKILLESPARAPSRAVFKEIGPWLAPSDPHFVSEFQFTQFDQRLWELYLWAAFRELGFDITQPEAPDFLCRAPGIEFTVEATTVSASTSGPLANHPNPQTTEEMAEFLTNYMPIKFGSSLVSKLNKKNKSGESYWERGATAGKPFILAIADFHKSGDETESGSMTYSQSALWPYLYGHRIEWEIIEGELVVRAVKGTTHAYAGKQVPTGFFDLPGAENVSAILFSNAGTLAKFDRMGVIAGYGTPRHKYYRIGLRFDPDSQAVNGTPFSEEITENSKEYWSDELQLFHNPNAKHPIERGVFAGITQHYFREGVMESLTPEGTVLASRTLIISPMEDAERAFSGD